jgi:hypothetical protein
MAGVGDSPYISSGSAPPCLPLVACAEGTKPGWVGDALGTVVGGRSAVLEDLTPFTSRYRTIQTSAMMGKMIRNG